MPAEASASAVARASLTSSHTRAEAPAAAAADSPPVAAAVPASPCPPSAARSRPHRAGTPPECRPARRTPPRHRGSRRAAARCRSRAARTTHHLHAIRLGTGRAGLRRPTVRVPQVVQGRARRGVAAPANARRGRAGPPPSTGRRRGCRCRGIEGRADANNVGLEPEDLGFSFAAATASPVAVFHMLRGIVVPVMDRAARGAGPLPCVQNGRRFLEPCARRKLHGAQ